MNYTVIKTLPNIEDIISEIPLSETGKLQVQQDRHEIKNIIEGHDNRLLMIVGPCSAWPNTAVLEYADRLAALNQKVKHALKLVMRVYIQKPRTTKGWTGPVNQPNPFAYPDLELGLRYARQMMVSVVEKGLSIADEALFMHHAKGFMELLSWVAIGARSAENPEHRIFASALDCAVGLKNPTHGSLAVGVNSVVAAQHSHVAAFDGYEVQTNGNPHAHLVLRGGNQKPNYGVEHLLEVKRLARIHHIQHPALVIDVSHDNCIIHGKKNHHRQSEIIFEVLKSTQQFKEIRPLVKGFMVESFIKDGMQKLDPSTPGSVDYNGLSITDPCLSWEATETMLLEVADSVSS